MAEKVKNQSAKARFLKFFREIKSELKKVVWPTRTQLINNTITVLVVCLVLGAFIWVLDYGLNLLRALIYV